MIGSGVYSRDSFIGNFTSTDGDSSRAALNRVNTVFEFNSYLNSSQRVTIVVTTNKSILFIDPGFLFTHICTELLVGKRLVQFVLPKEIKPTDI